MQFIRAPKQACLVLHSLQRRYPKQPVWHPTQQTETDRNKIQRIDFVHSVLFRRNKLQVAKTYLTPASLHGRFTRFKQARRNTLSTVSLASAPKGSSSGSLVGCAFLLPSACRVSSLLLSFMIGKNMALAIIAVFGEHKVCSTVEDVRGEDTTLALGVNESLSPRTHYNVPSHCLHARTGVQKSRLCLLKSTGAMCQDET